MTEAQTGPLAEPGLTHSVAHLRTSLEDIPFPAIGDEYGRLLMSLLFQLERSQWWSPEMLAGHQFQQLNRLVSHARVQVPYYREQLSAGESPAIDRFDRASWRCLPVLERRHIQAAGDRLIAQTIPPGHGKTSQTFTSGSTGKPVRVITTELWRAVWHAVTVRDHLWHRDMPGVMAVMRDTTPGKHLYPDGTKTQSWGPASGRLFETGPCIMLNINSSIEQQIDWLCREEPDYLFTMPTLVYRLAKYCEQHRIQFKKLRQVATLSEVVHPHIREVVKEVWNVPLVDMYTTRETGYLALQCPKHAHYHIQSEATYVEVLNDQGEACKPGEIGRVVVTPMHNFAMPLIRYAIGDYAEVGEPCDCGRGLPVIRQILGRTQNMLTLPNGEQRFPLLSAGNIRALLEIAPIRQYQLVQKKPDLLELRLVVDRATTEAEETALVDWVRHKFSFPFEVRFRYMEEIPRTAAGKYFDFYSEVERA